MCLESPSKSRAVCIFEVSLKLVSVDFSQSSIGFLLLYDERLSVWSIAGGCGAAVCCGKVLSAEWQSVTEKLLYRKWTGALSRKGYKNAASHIRLFARVCSLWLRLWDLKEEGVWGRCWSDGGGVAASGVGLPGTYPADWTGITELWV
ncbi:hypothetical protein KUCAC02_008639 [Chaenocephalus aceratus]|uniref:Uncharacterized protein n=1 Tax=Chaenocephalus aceratus TaxID=36190 RepID=A0ACB9WR52_CHAAC|nr:hypothetical protein KUCAC02_008639 [Chaenocephalus aceratus]